MKWMFILLFITIPCVLFAYEPPSIKITEALKNGKTAFIGRIIEIKEIEYDTFFATGMMKIKILRGLYGKKYNKDQIVNVKFNSIFLGETDNPGFPLEVKISDVLLIILNNNPKNDTIQFNSKYKGGIDLAYFYLDNSLSWDKSMKDTISLWSVYSNQKECITEKDLNILINSK